MKWGLLGVAHVHAAYYAWILAQAEDMSLLGASDDDLESCRRWASEHGATAFSTHEELLDHHPDAVVICSPTAHHLRLVRLAAERGIPALCEKPLALSNEASREIVRVCEQAGVILGTAFAMRSSVPMIEARAFLRADGIGKVLAVTGQNPGKNPALEAPWFADPALSGGGAIADHVVHIADILRWWFECEIVRVHAVGNSIIDGDTSSVETAAIVSLRLENGVIATIDPSWSKPQSFPAWGWLSLEVVGTEGVLSANAHAQRLQTYADRPVWVDWASDSGTEMLRDFAAAIRTGRAPRATGWDGLKATEVVLAAYESLETGEPVAL